MNKTDIEWCDMTWNPVTGCLHGCPYCYAQQRIRRFEGYMLDGKITTYNPYDGPVVLESPLMTADQFEKPRRAAFPFGFDPTFHVYRLDEAKKTKKPQNVFVGSMCDMFGNWVPDDWITRVFSACTEAPQHRFLFLTKNPMRYLKLEADGNLLVANNMWYGTTITTPDKVYSYTESEEPNLFVSIEPLHGDFGDCSFMNTGVKWVIIGAETGQRADKIVPEKSWVSNIVESCRREGLPVFMKNSLRPFWDGALLREYPWERAE